MTIKLIFLYEIPNGSKVYSEVSDGSTYFIFNHIDGGYSHNTSEKGETLHIEANAPVELHKDGYRLLFK